MNFTEVCAQVLDIVKRPDKVGAIRREVNSAISHFCTDADFERDLVEAAPSVDPAAYTQSLSLSGLLRFRKVWYIKRGGTKCFLTKISPRNLMENGCDTRDTYYQVGDSLVLSLSALAATMDLGYLRYPPTLTDTAGTFWLLDVSPYAVIDRAASKLFADIGDDKSARMHEAAAASAFVALRRDQGIAI